MISVILILAALFALVRDAYQFAADSSYNATWMLVATWKDVVPDTSQSNMPTPKPNTFQAVVITNGVSVVIMFNYETINWITPESIRSVIPPAQVGFDAGDGRNYYSTPSSRTAAVINVTLVSNVGISGKMMFLLSSSANNTNANNSIVLPDIRAATSVSSVTSSSEQSTSIITASLPLTSVIESTGSSEQSTSIITASLPLTSVTESTSRVCSNGLISLDEAYKSFTTKPFPLRKSRRSAPLICPFWTDVDLTYTGDLWIRETTDPGLLQRASREVRDAYKSADDTAYNATWMLVATWENVLPFIHPVSNYKQIVGFDAGDGRNFYATPSSQTSRVKNLTSNSNVGIPGRMIFYLGTAGNASDNNQGIVLPDEVTTTGQVKLPSPLLLRKSTTVKPINDKKINFRGEAAMRSDLPSRMTTPGTPVTSKVVSQALSSTNEQSSITRKTTSETMNHADESKAGTSQSSLNVSSRFTPSKFLRAEHTFSRSHLNTAAATTQDNTVFTQGIAPMTTVKPKQPTETSPSPSGMSVEKHLDKSNAALIIYGSLSDEESSGALSLLVILQKASSSRNFSHK
ncbi:uncharacterized protein [Watersipora subatra]|uniref:uncharacterized protein n=1 Tax=Watersipora subatra TaxID=2589382 RepID=UPI00355B3157